jgi:ubiquitin C
LIENKATGASFSLVVDLSDTISNLKATIHRHPHGLPKAFQNLTLNKESLSSITEERTLRECSIKHNDTLLLDDIEIKIQLPDSRTTTIRVAPTATIGHVMSSIENFDGSPFDEQLVTENGEILDDRKKTLFDCQVPHKSMLFVKPMQINIDMPSGKTIPIVVSPHDTIFNIKSKLEQKESIPVADQKLMLNDKELADTKTISQYGIKHGTTLNLAGMLIFIQHFNGNTLKLPVVATNTLLDVKKMVQTSEKTPTNEQNIVFGGSLLCHDDRTLCDFKIKNRATLKLEPMKIYVQAPTGKFPLVVEPTLKVLVLKGMIQEKVGTAPQDQTLLHHGDELSDLEATLTVCGLQHLDTVNLEVKGQPTYKVKLGEYQSAFEFVPSPRKKREGVRARKTINTLGDFHSTIAGNEVCKFGHKTG